MVYGVKVSLNLAILLSGMATLQAVETRAQKKLKLELQQYQSLAHEALEDHAHDAYSTITVRNEALETCVTSLQVREQQLKDNDSSMLKDFTKLRIACQDKIRTLVEYQMYHEQLNAQVEAEESKKKQEELAGDLTKVSTQAEFLGNEQTVDDMLAAIDCKGEGITADDLGSVRSLVTSCKRSIAKIMMRKERNLGTKDEWQLINSYNELEKKCDLYLQKFERRLANDLGFQVTQLQNNFNQSRVNN